MTFYEIKQNIRNWDAIRDDSEMLKSLLAGDRLFNFTPQIPADEEKTALHLYPAVEDEKVIFYIINTAYDKKVVYNEYQSEFLNFITKVELEQKSSDEFDEVTAVISDKEALQRIDNWNNMRETFIDDTVGPEFLQAFAIDAPDEELQTNLTSMFGLVKNEGSDGSSLFTLELIFVNSDRVYFNTVYPVPPYGQEPEEAFFLLEAAMGRVY